jgi:hypothetical protein
LSGDGDQEARLPFRFNQTVADIWLDPVLVDAFLGDAQDPRGEELLADQVAHLLPFHAELPNPLASALSRITAHLGGDAGLLEWLDRHPGRPRLTARLFVLISLLDRFSADPVVVNALRELRAEIPYPPGLARYLVPDTTEETLAALSYHIEVLLGDDRKEDAVQLAFAVCDMLELLVDIDLRTRELANLAARARKDIGAASDET